MTLSAESWVLCESSLKWSEQLTSCIKKPVPNCFLGQGNIATLEVMKAPTRERIAVEVILCFLMWETNDSSLCRVASSDRESPDIDRESMSCQWKSLVLLAILSACVGLVVPVKRRKPTESAERVVINDRKSYAKLWVIAWRKPSSQKSCDVPKPRISHVLTRT